MSKIDEVYRKHVLNQGDKNTDYSIIFKILDELKPYVELAEMIIDINITCDLEFRSREDYSRFGELYQQIKEQNK